MVSPRRRVDGFGQVVPQVPAVGDLGGQRCALGGAFGLAPAAVPADDLRAGVGAEPGPEGLRGPLGEHVHRSAGLDVHQHGGVALPFAQAKSSTYLALILILSVFPLVATLRTRPERARWR